MESSDISGPGLKASSKLTFSRLKLTAAFLLALIPALVAFWTTCYPSITWWDTAEYATAAICLGNPHPPGSLLLTLLGWLVTRLPLGLSDIFSLNLFAGLIAAVTGGMVTLIAARLVETTDDPEEAADSHNGRWAALIGVVLGALTLTLGETVWLYAIQLTPYILTLLFTSLILWAAFTWWRKAGTADALRWLFILGLLIGLDFSVHRTNAVLLPGLLVWILLRHPRTLASIKAWLTGAAGLVIALSLHLLIMPIAARRPFLNGGYPDTWSRFWDYVTLKQLGGGFLVKFFPRQGDIWADQTVDFLKAFAANFFSADGLWYLGGLPLLLGLAGLVFIWGRHRRLAIAFTSLLVITSVTTILYFNIPADFFRSLHRHYLPCLLIFGVLIAYGAGILSMEAWRTIGKTRVPIVAVVGLLLLAMPASQIIRNDRAVDGSGNYFTEDFARNMFAGLDANAILLVGGDNDTFPLWFLQVADNVRPDVTVLNLSLLNTSWYVKDQKARDPRLPLTLTDEEIDQLRPTRWNDTTIAIATPENLAPFGLPDDAAVPDSIYLKVGPSYDQYMMVGDRLVLEMFLDNQWRRPFYIAATAGPTRLPWLAPYLRMEALVLRAVPMESPPLNREELKRTLLDRYTYRGWTDPEVNVDFVTRQTSVSVAGGFMMLAGAEARELDTAGVRETLAELEERMPLDRLQPPERLYQTIERLTGATGD